MTVLAGRRVLVAGLGVAGRSAVAALRDVGADVSVTSDGPVDGGFPAALLGPLDRVPDGVDLVVASPGYRPTHPLLADAAARGVPVWGELELAWQLRGDGGAAPWLALTGTNGKTTTVHMLESILRTAGSNAVAVGNVGVPVIDAVRDPALDVLAVEVSSQQLHFAPSLHPAAGAVLNLAPDHLDWHGSFEAYAAAKFRLLDADVAIGNLDDPLVASALPAGAVGFTLGEPAEGQLGVLDGRLVSRAFGDDRAVLAAVGEIRPAGAHNVANALAAAALARAHGVGPATVGEGLRSFIPDPHRNQSVLVRDGVEWVDDSKATNPHAASASLNSYERIVWVAGGRLKGVDVDPLVAAVADRLAGAVLLGEDRRLIETSLARHAPEIPVIVVDSTDDGAMTEVVRAAARIAGAGSTVLLAPAGASYDMFADYGARGDAFAAAAREVGR
ncbi:UDP-N-acetylmuramoyl-L-alanine--D-glutamate ligase [Jatrophihabitans endophyticus]|uniref:UDP-N-acetylmuramoyl-L-alanine--D-glutamate ligase n=1 Tax=Jatrophihabitans endophyticus TaxID=1206085 RepID=UPI001A077540|nr:UDP-N-acetylmuramoyl-L-alanine--D-glutamate ligase [Jatrophihabitans endophyticus]MBE7188184.1 UDP-N-acetylmuramoyl-L-alanine--D-glutamate ligase [Jatrophihabitans endophyticus]